MEETKNGTKLVPPYLPHRTFFTFIESLRATAIPNRIDRSVMGRFSGAAQSSLLAAFRYLGLMTHEGKPTDLLVRLVNSQGPEQKQLLREMLRLAYPFLFESGFDLERATQQELQERFRQAGVSGDTVRKCMSFFLGVAREAELKVSPYLSSGRRSPRGESRSRRTRTTAEGKAGRIKMETQDAQEQIQLRPATWAQMLLSKFPTFDPAWPDEIKAKWFDAFQWLMTHAPDTDTNPDSRGGE